MRKLKVPPPITENTPWALVTLCVPDTPEWHYLLRSCLTSLVRGRSYDEETGNIKQAIQVAHEVLDSMARCENIESALIAIRESIRQLRLSVNVNSVCCDSINEPPPPPPPPPSDGWQGAPGAGSVPDSGYGQYTSGEAYRTAACDMVNGLIHAVFKQLDWVDQHQGWVLGAGVIAGLLLLLFPEAVTSVLGAATLATIATAIFTTLDVGEVFSETRQDLESWLSENWQLVSDDLCNLMTLQELLLTIYSLLYERVVLALVARGVSESIARQMFCWLDGRMVFHQMTEFLAQHNILQPDPNYTYYPCPCNPPDPQFVELPPTTQQIHVSTQCQAEFVSGWWHVQSTDQWPVLEIGHAIQVPGRRHVGLVFRYSSTAPVQREIRVAIESYCHIPHLTSDTEKVIVLLSPDPSAELLNFVNAHYSGAFVHVHTSGGCNLTTLLSLRSGVRYGPGLWAMQVAHIMEKL